MNRLSLGIFCIILSNGIALGQDIRASIRGTVTDPSGAAVQGARVVVRNVATAVESRTTTNVDGQYSVMFLSPGGYTISVDKEGFRRVERKDVFLQTSVQAGIDFQLALGAVAESVSVQATTELLETEKATRGNTIASQLLLDLPNNGRSAYHTILSAMGVTRASRSWGSFGNAGLGSASGITINGGIAKENETVMDGVADTLPNRDVAFQPPIEAVVETKVQTSSYDASYGRFGGGVVAITTKSGTNQLHGILFETNRNAALAANPWASNFLGVPRPGGNSNQFGFEVDGPVYIPKLANGKNRLFFMLSMDSRRTASPGGSSTILPDQSQRQGDFSSIPRVIYDPLTTIRSGNSYVRTPFARNVVPADRINPVARRVLDYVPLPNLNGRPYGLANYLSNVGSTSSYDQFLGRVDWRINDKNALQFTYGQLPYAEKDEVLFGDDNPADVSRENPLARGFHRYTLDWATTISAGATFNFRFGYSKYTELNQQPAAIGFNPSDLGMDPQLVRQFGRLQFPRFETGGPYASIGSPNPYQRGARDTMSWQANYNQLNGRHLWKAGAEFRLYNNNTLQPGLASGLYQFSRGFSQADPLRTDALSGDEFASFLLGYPSGGRVDLNIDPAYRGRYLTLFAQDDFKVTPWLTINVGMRWDYEEPNAERYNRMVRGFAFQEPSPLAQQVAGLRGGLIYAGTEGSNRLAFNPDKNNFQPRIGFVARLRPWLVMRGGYGLYYLGQSAQQPSTGFSAVSPIVSSVDGGLTPRINLTNPIPEGLTQPFGSSRGLATNLGQGVTFGYLDRVLPLSHQASFGFQSKLPAGFVGEVSYSMNLTRRYPVNTELNNIPRSELGRPSAYYTEPVPNPLAGLLPANPALNDATIPRRNLLVPFPQYTSVAMTDVPIGRNDYHALQARLSRRYENGLIIDLSYVWSKALEQRTFLNPQDFNYEAIELSKLERRLTEFDIPHKFSMLAAWELPFGPGKLLARNAQGLVHRLFSGWIFGANLTLQSGFPLNFPNAPALESRSARLPDDQRSLYRAFDTSLFPSTAPPPFEYRTWPTRFPDVRTYPLRNLDASIMKRTRIFERLSLEIRAEMYNATNTPWFGEQDSNGTDVTRLQFGRFRFGSNNSARGVALVGRLLW